MYASCGDVRRYIYSIEHLVRKFPHFFWVNIFTPQVGSSQTSIVWTLRTSYFTANRWLGFIAAFKCKFPVNSSKSARLRDNRSDRSQYRTLSGPKLNIYFLISQGRLGRAHSSFHLSIFKRSIMFSYHEQ